MLEKVVTFLFMLFVFFAFTFVASIGVTMFVQWGAVQNQAQFVAASMGRWGGYTQEAENSVRDFAARIKQPRYAVRVEVSDPGPVPFGQPVWARITVPFEFRVGPFDVGTYDLTGLGRSVSSYLPGAYQVAYMSP